MARYIDAEELKKRAYPFPCAIGVEYAVSVRQIDETPTADVVPKSEWISVDERLPEETEKELEIVQGTDKTKRTAKVSELVLVYSDYPENPYITVDITIDGVWSNNWCVTHWMPLPEAPKMKGGAK